MVAHLVQDAQHQGKILDFLYWLGLLLLMFSPARRRRSCFGAMSGGRWAG